jgi:hypothetical protein
MRIIFILTALLFMGCDLDPTTVSTPETLSTPLGSSTTDSQTLL